jgi:hypothetical protein
VTGGVQQALGSQDIRLDEGGAIQNAPVNVRFGREVDDRIDSLSRLPELYGDRQMSPRTKV